MTMHAPGRPDGYECDKTRLDLARTQALLDVQTATVAAHMSAAYKSGEATWLDVLVQADSFADL